MTVTWIMAIGDNIDGCVAGAPISVFAKVPRGLTFFPIQAQQSSRLGESDATEREAFKDEQCEQCAAQHFAVPPVATLELDIGQHSLAEHIAAQTPGAIALANIRVASTRRMTIPSLPRVLININPSTSSEQLFALPRK